MTPLAPERVALLKAADLIERNGWRRGQAAYDGTDERRCMINALADVTIDGLGDDIELFRAADLLVKKIIPKPIAWNDTPGRTQAEVVAMLRAAAVHGL